MNSNSPLAHSAWCEPTNDPIFSREMIARDTDHIEEKENVEKLRNKFDEIENKIAEIETKLPNLFEVRDEIPNDENNVTMHKSHLQKIEILTAKIIEKLDNMSINSQPDIKESHILTNRVCTTMPSSC